MRLSLRRTLQLIATLMNLKKTDASFFGMTSKSFFSTKNLICGISFFL